MVDQNKLRIRMKIAKINDSDIHYSDVAQMLEVKTQSLYNFLHGQYDLKQEKAKKLLNWLSDQDEFEI